jgi:hypothetical protein
VADAVCVAPPGTSVVPISFSLNGQQYTFAGKFHYGMTCFDHTSSALTNIIVDPKLSLEADYRYLIFGASVFALILIVLISWAVVRRLRKRNGYQEIIGN